MNNPELTQLIHEYRSIILFLIFLAVMAVLVIAVSTAHAYGDNDKTCSKKE